MIFWFKEKTNERKVPYISHRIVWQKQWYIKLRIGRLYFYLSNCRMKRRPVRDMIYTNNVQDRCVLNKQKLYERQGGCCPHCGQAFGYDVMELHHVLPLSRFPELGKSIRNGIMLCHKCHKEIHNNPYKEIAMMEAKAKELNINIRDYYDY